MNDARLSLLVSRHLDGQLSRDERLELEDALRDSLSAREQFWREAKLHALLHEAEKSGIPPVIVPVPRRKRWALAILATAAGLTLVILGGSLTWRDASTPVSGEATTTAIAVLSRSIDATWSSAANAHAVNEVLQPGWLHLASGLAHVEFYNGVRVVLEGPSDLHLASAQEVHLRMGRLRADVPPVARGFTVTTPRLRVVDLGTEFGVSVRDTQEEVHVFKGRVTLRTAGGPVHEVAEGKAMAVSGDAEPQAIAPTPASFANAADLGRKTQQAEDQRLRAWQQATTRMHADTALLVHFDFAKDAITDRTLANRAPHGAAAGDGVIVGCNAVEGRWPSRQALQFRGESDRVRVRVPGNHHALTLIAWTRIDALDRPFNSLFMTDDFAVGAVHWQIRADGSLHLGIAAPAGQPAERYNFDTPHVFDAGNFGRWKQLAMVYDGAQRRMTHYVDGQPVGRYTLADDVALRIEHAELGNWNPSTSTDGTPIRNLTGCMDEFALFTRALTDQELLALYRSGSGIAVPEKP